MRSIHACTSHPSLRTDSWRIRPHQFGLVGSGVSAHWWNLVQKPGQEDSYGTRSHILPALFSIPLHLPEALLITPTPFSLHKHLPPAASFKQLYRTRPTRLPEPTCALNNG